MAGGVHDRGTCMVAGACMDGGMCGRGCAWQGGMHGRGCAWQGVCMVGGMHGGGMHGRGHAWQGGMHAMHFPLALRDTVSKCAGDTYPTAMHSCFRSVYLLKFEHSSKTVWKI